MARSACQVRTKSHQRPGGADGGEGKVSPGGNEKGHERATAGLTEYLYMLEMAFSGAREPSDAIGRKRLPIRGGGLHRGKVAMGGGLFNLMIPHF